jgi:uncharacterized membrane protein
MEPRYVRSALALGIVLGGMVIIFLIWAIRGSTESKDLTGFLIGTIGAVVGFYFGRQGVDAAQDLASTEAAQKAKAAEELANAKTAAAKAQENADQAGKVIQTLLEDPDLQERVNKAVQQLGIEER